MRMRGWVRRSGRPGEPATRRVIPVALAGALGFFCGPRIEAGVRPVMEQAVRLVHAQLQAAPGPSPAWTSPTWPQVAPWLLERTAHFASPAGLSGARPAGAEPQPNGARPGYPANHGRRVVPGEAARPDPPADAVLQPPARAPRYRVAIYHTHTSEEYAPPGGEDGRASPYHRFGTTQTGIVRVGRALAESLRRLGVPAVHVEAVHDYPDYPMAYARSRETVRSLIERYPELELLIDLHRDAPQDGGSLVTRVAGREVARVALVVGRGALHPQPAPNRGVAEELARVAESRFPGLMRRILEVSGRTYNQDLHPGALLVEIGSYRTDERAAVRAAQLLAEVIAETLRRRAVTPVRF